MSNTITTTIVKTENHGWAIKGIITNKDGFSIENNRCNFKTRKIATAVAEEMQSDPKLLNFDVAAELERQAMVAYNQVRMERNFR